jgi:hypothetical protein
MRKQLVKTTVATLAAVEYPVADYLTPFLRGNECILVLEFTNDWDAATILIRTDNDTDAAGDAAWTTVVNANLDIDATSLGTTQMYNITLGDNIEITTGTFAAGSLTVSLLGNT